MRRRTLARLTTAAASLSLLTALAPAAAANGDRDHRPPAAHLYKRVGYFTQWGVYGRDFQVKDLESSGTAAKLTHINYAFGKVSPQGTRPSATGCGAARPPTSW
ncbi:hypothetical protein ACWGI8_25035 [Streptomyces sp. NPDC054841]